MGLSIKLYLNLIISIILINYFVQTKQINDTVLSPANKTCQNGYCNMDDIEDEDKHPANWINKYAAGQGQASKDQHPVMNEGYLRQSSIIFGLTKTATYETLNSLCYKQMKEIERAILRKDVWAMKGE